MAGRDEVKDPFELRKLYKYLRIVDVCDALDGIGYFDLMLMSREVRPLWLGMKFWGVALTMRCVPTNRPMWKLNTTQEIVDAHSIWFNKVPSPSMEGLIKPGHVIVTNTGCTKEVGYWGSNNSMAMVAAGAVGIVTDGYVRDTAELALQRTPVCASAVGRTIIPGRIELVELQTRIGCGGVQVRPGDIIGCDDDGVVVVPVEIAEEVAIHARAVLLADMKGRAALYQRLSKEPDETVDCGAVEDYYRGL